MADENGIIENGFHKNHPANTQALCKKCHKIKTKNNVKQIKKKTSKGTILFTVS